MARRHVLASLRPSAIFARSLRRIFANANNRWLLAGGFAVYVIRALTKGPLSRRFPASRGSTRLDLAEGARYLIKATPRSQR